jgi:hypothetical protein
MRSIIVDSGLLIALFDSSDRDHEQAVAFLESVQGRLITNLPVITDRQAQPAGMVTSGRPSLPPDSVRENRSIR